MEDLLYLVTVLVAFAALAGFMRLCDRVIGPSEGGAPAHAGRDDEGREAPR